MSKIDIIQDKVSILDVLDFYKIPVSRSGFIRCPFHNDKHPSCKVYDKTNNIKCFSCGAKENVVGFVARIESVPVKKAIQIISDRYCLGIADCLSEEEIASFRQQRKKKDQEKYAQKKMQEEYIKDCNRLHELRERLFQIVPSEKSVEFKDFLNDDFRVDIASSIAYEIFLLERKLDGEVD